MLNIFNGPFVVENRWVGNFGYRRKIKENHEIRRNIGFWSTMASNMLLWTKKSWSLVASLISLGDIVRWGNENVVIADYNTLQVVKSTMKMANFRARRVRVKLEKSISRLLLVGLQQKLNVVLKYSLKIKTVKFCSFVISSCWEIVEEPDFNNRFHLRTP